MDRCALASILDLSLGPVPATGFLYDAARVRGAVISDQQLSHRQKVEILATIADEALRSAHFLRRLLSERE